ncbi:MAG: hypothetical protein EOQ39_08950 [Mesorhizobium sp.]|uniref:hypothetical protein n=1 Tax=Mesorhizobium sp. TaxID=1871066 RepID=UPI000FE79CA1|nr:hypothetical protein [Mesorhizobium sp.]RWB05525.1 MAG: hypothetical protein EOQ37_14815 [Mesorhizobium sp.]RWB16639.1 MAG: hypothetical protein EOQ39_08950 [Mesorhizobium sp.]
MVRAADEKPTAWLLNNERPAGQSGAAPISVIDGFRHKSDLAEAIALANRRVPLRLSRFDG